MRHVPGWTRRIRLTKILVVDRAVAVEFPGSIAHRLTGLKI